MACGSRQAPVVLQEDYFVAATLTFSQSSSLLKTSNCSRNLEFPQQFAIHENFLNSLRANPSPLESSISIRKRPDNKTGPSIGAATTGSNPYYKEPIGVKMTKLDNITVKTPASMTGKWTEKWRGPVNRQSQTDRTEV